MLPGSFEHALCHLVDHEFDLSDFHSRHKNDIEGAPAFDPAALIKIVLLDYSRGMISRRKIEAACRGNVLFIAISGDTRPHFTTLAAFVSELGDTVAKLFARVLLICDRQGLIGREMFAIDGVKLPSNASKATSGTRADYLSLAYANADSQGVSTGEPIVVQTGPTSFVTLPTLIGQSIGNSDTFVGALGLRYGLTAKTEIYARASALASSQRTSGVAGASSSSEARFADAWAGINVQFKKDDATPALLGFAEVALREKHRHGSASLKSAMLGITTYKAIDPVVFALTAGARFNQSRRDGARSYRPGKLLLINPSVGFAANDRVTLTTGLQWTRRQADRFDGQTQGMDRTATDLLLGVGYGFDKGNTLNTTFKANASGGGGAELRANWLYTFR